jgi:hypothetical protein
MTVLAVYQDYPPIYHTSAPTCGLNLPDDLTTLRIALEISDLGYHLALDREVVRDGDQN